MQMDHPEIQIILDDDREKINDVINEEEVDCAGLRQLGRCSRYAKILEPHWENEKSYFQLIEEKKVTFEDDKTNMKPILIVLY